MLNVRSERHSRRFWLLILVLLIISSLTATFLKVVIVGAPKSVSSVVTIKKVTINKISANVLFTGNTYWGRYINDWSMASTLKYSYPFSRLNEFDRNSYDAWISGLECPTVPDIKLSSSEEDATLNFNCSPNYLPEAAKWFTAFTLANNHTDNQGADGFKTTQAQLEKAGIQYFGTYDPSITDDICEVIALPVTVTKSDKTVTKGKLPIAFCGYEAVFKLPDASAVNAIKKYSDIMPVVAMPHMGTEYKSSPDELKTSFYRSLIDAGADMVLGDHPHWIQTSESYKGHLIVYSMGNFMFDQQDTAEVTRSAAVRMLLQSGDNSPNSLSKWMALGQKCGGYKDNCLDIAKSENLEKLSITYKFDIIGTNDADRIVKPATFVQTASILERLNWRSTVNQLQAPYSGL